MRQHCWRFNSIFFGLKFCLLNARTISGNRLNWFGIKCKHHTASNCVLKVMVVPKLFFHVFLFYFIFWIVIYCIMLNVHKWGNLLKREINGIWKKVFERNFVEDGVEGRNRLIRGNWKRLKEARRMSYHNLIRLLVY